MEEKSLLIPVPRRHSCVCAGSGDSVRPSAVGFFLAGGNPRLISDCGCPTARALSKNAHNSKAEKRLAPPPKPLNIVLRQATWRSFRAFLKNRILILLRVEAKQECAAHRHAPKKFKKFSEIPSKGTHIPQSQGRAGNARAVARNGSEMFRMSFSNKGKNRAQ